MKLFKDGTIKRFNGRRSVGEFTTFIKNTLDEVRYYFLTEDGQLCDPTQYVIEWYSKTLHHFIPSLLILKSMKAW